MKLMPIIVALTLLASTARSQSYYQPNAETGIAMGLSGGYSSKQCMIGTLSLGAMFPARTHFSTNIIILSEIKNPDVPSIFEARVGHVFNTTELYGGAGYHIAGSDNKIAANPNSGIRPAFGVIQHFRRSPWTISAGMSGKIFSLQLGLFGVR
ncbi:MAG TPA: hypothetical protein VF540_06935 [Segetibacter sp.]